MEQNSAVPNLATAASVSSLPTSTSATISNSTSVSKLQFVLDDVGFIFLDEDGVNKFNLQVNYC